MLKMIDPDRALEIVLANVAESSPIDIHRSQATGFVLTEGVKADRDYPPFARAMMDGYAVRLADAGGKVKVETLIAAGHKSDFIVETGKCAEIMTGAACPAGTEAVVQYEIVKLDGDRITLPDTIKVGMNIAGRGSECRQGQKILKPGVIVTPLTVAVLATFGIDRIKVHHKPSMSIISTGDEIAVEEQALPPAKIRNSNGPMLAALAEELGITVASESVIPDDANLLEAALLESRNSNMVVLNGGVSMGKYDLVPEILVKSGVKILFHKVAQKPGKPFLFGIRDNQLVFGLPGNPLACHLGFYRYIAPAARKMAALPYESLQTKGILTDDISYSGKRTLFQLVRAENQDGNALPLVMPLKGKGSADVFTSATANGYLRLEPDCGMLKEGDIVDFEFIGSQRWRT